MQLDQFNIEKEKTEVQAKKNVEHEFKLIGSARHTPGLTLFAVNIKTGDIHPAEFEKESTINFMNAREKLRRKKVLIEKDCIYIEALNKRSAMAKIIKTIKRNS